MGYRESLLCTDQLVLSFIPPTTSSSWGISIGSPKICMRLIADKLDWQFDAEGPPALSVNFVC